MRIRPAQPADIPEMMDLARHAVTASHWSRQQYEGLFSSGGPSGLALAIEEEGVVRGFLIARNLGPEWQIENIAVAGPARRRGLGTRLVGELIDRARVEQAQAVFLEVRRSNRAARSLYEKWAFVESGHRKSYYHDPAEDAVTYRLSLE